MCISIFDKKTKIKKIRILDWPGNLPDMNPIESSWKLTKTEISQQVISNKRQLIVKLMKLGHYCTQWKWEQCSTISFLFYNNSKITELFSPTSRIPISHKFVSLNNYVFSISVCHLTLASKKRKLLSRACPLISTVPFSISHNYFLFY